MIRVLKWDRTGKVLRTSRNSAWLLYNEGKKGDKGTNHITQTFKVFEDFWNLWEIIEDFEIGEWRELGYIFQKKFTVKRTDEKGQEWVQWGSYEMAQMKNQWWLKTEKARDFQDIFGKQSQ